MKQTIRMITAVTLVLMLAFSAVACRSGSNAEIITLNKDNSEASQESQKEAEEIEEDLFIGVYTGTSNETHYWDGGAQKQLEKSFCIYKHVDYYYATTAISDIQEEGPDAYYQNIYIDGNRTIENLTCGGGFSKYVDICHLNEDQCISTTYTITFTDNGIEIKWDSQSVYAGEEPQPYETGVFTGTMQ